MLRHSERQGALGFAVQTTHFIDSDSHLVPDSGNLGFDIATYSHHANSEGSKETSGAHAGPPRCRAIALHPGGPHVRLNPD